MKRLIKAVAEWLPEHKYAYIFPVYMIIYLIWFFSLEFVTYSVVHYIHSPLDDLIPFCEYFIVPYSTWFLALAGAPVVFAAADREDFLRLCFVMYVGMTIALITYIVWPTGLQLREELPRENFFCFLVSLIRGADTPYNVCPSIHVSSSVAIALVTLSARCLKGKKHGVLIKAAVALWMLLICISTVFVKQHSIIDVYWGAGLSLALYLISFALPFRKTGGREKDSDR